MYRRIEKCQKVMSSNFEEGDLVVYRDIHGSPIQGAQQGIGLVISRSRYGARVYWFSHRLVRQYFVTHLKRLEIPNE